jgi:hypothetical protein
VIDRSTYYNKLMRYTPIAIAREFLLHCDDAFAQRLSPSRQSRGGSGRGARASFIIRRIMRSRKLRTAP